MSEGKFISRTNAEAFHAFADVSRHALKLNGAGTETKRLNQSPAPGFSHC